MNCQSALRCHGAAKRHGWRRDRAGTGERHRAHQAQSTCTGQVTIDGDGACAEQAQDIRLLTRRDRTGQTQRASAAVDLCVIHQCDGCLAATQHHRSVRAANGASHVQRAWRSRDQATRKVHVIRRHAAQLQSASVVQCHGIAHSHVGTQDQVERFGFYRQRGCGQAAIEGDGVLCFRQHHAGVGGHRAREGGEFTVHHFQGFQWVSCTHSAIDVDGSKIAAIECQAACAWCVTVDCFGEGHLTGCCHTHVVEDFDDVIEHRIGGGVNDRALDLGFAFCRGGRIGVQAQKRCGTADIAAQHGGAAVVEGERLCAVDGGHQGHIHTAQNRGSTKGDGFVDGLCARGFDEATVDHQAATAVGGEACQCCAITDCTVEGDDTRCVERQTLRTVERAAKRDGTTASAAQHSGSTQCGGFAINL